MERKGSQKSIAPWKLNEMPISKEEIDLLVKKNLCIYSVLCVVPSLHVALTILMRSVLENRRGRDHNIVKKDTEGS